MFAPTTPLQTRISEIALRVLPKLLELRPTHFRVRLGAALVDRRGSILTLGFNQTKTHPRAAEWHKRANRPHQCTTIHAEMDCLMNAERLGIDTRGKSLIVSRIKFLESNNRTNVTLGLALPCPSCYICLSEFGVARTYFTTDDLNLGELR